MNLSIVKSAAVATAKVTGKLMSKTSTKSPELLIGAGIVCFVGSIVAACEATKKVPEIKEETAEEIEAVKNMDISESDYTEKDRERALSISYGKMVLKIGAKYMPCIALGCASIALFLSSYGIMKKRVATLTVALNGVTEAFNAYRDRVKAQIGEEKESDIFRGIETKDIMVQDENGKTHKVKKAKTMGKTRSPYVFLFDEVNSYRYSKNVEYNRFFLKQAERQMNDQYKINGGHLFLNEALDILGINRTAIGATHGWHKAMPNTDGYISMNVFNAYDSNAPFEGSKEFLYGKEPAVWIEFNCDGMIYDCDLTK